MNNTLQIVTFEHPFPPVYGGIIDVFYKIKSLHEQGIRIILHCFVNKIPEDDFVSNLCERVFIYPRKRQVSRFFSMNPFIVASRSDKQLLHNILQDPAPVLFEGLHSCRFLGDPLLKHHKQFVRMHNIEHDYYQHLSLSENHLFKKLYYKVESFKLKRFEYRLEKASGILAISQDDYRYFDQRFGRTMYVPAFHPYQQVISQAGKGSYVLYHANLTVPENRKALRFLVQNVFNRVSCPVVVAGRSTGRGIPGLRKYPGHITVVENPDQHKMETLIRNAHICLLITFQDTGIKLKLLASLFAGRFCVVNHLMARNTGLDDLCHVADRPQEMISAINELMDSGFSQNEIHMREIRLQREFNNATNARSLIQHIFQAYDN